MIRKVFHRVGLFGRTYAMVLVSVLFAESLIFTMMLTRPPSMPALTRFDGMVAALMQGSTDRSSQLSLVDRSSQEIFQRDDASSLMLAAALALRLRQSPETIAVRLAAIGPPTPILGVPSTSVDGVAEPEFVLGDFVVARRLPDGRWRELSTDGSFQREVRWRLLMVLLGTLAAVVPFSYVLARRTVRPIRRFAEAAERIGKHPDAQPLTVSGPPEVRMASEAMNFMQARLARYIEQRTSMVAAMAHDLRTPLMRMAFQIEDAEEATRTRLSRQIAEMRTMIDVVLAYVRDERIQHSREKLDFASIVRAVSDNACDAGDDVTCVVEGRAIIFGDPYGLRSVVENLVGNAIHYGVRARVHLRIEPEAARLTIDDDGPGLPSSELEHVFDPFYRLEESRSRNTGGIGLGLAVVRAIILAHDGQVWLENRAERGLRACVRLPMGQ